VLKPRARDCSGNPAVPPQAERLRRFRGIGAESPVFGGFAAKNAPKIKKVPLKLYQIWNFAEIEIAALLILLIVHCSLLPFPFSFFPVPHC
jgi:hypothetical protein